MLRLTRIVTLIAGLVALCLLTAAPAPATHPRPQGATPLRMSLVPAYRACTAPTANRSHGPPLAFPSCNPPAQTSAQATVGTPDAFGGGANATGFLRLSVRQCICGTLDEVDMLIDVALNDVRCVPTGARCGTANTSGPADYAGETRLSFPFRLTDHWNATAPGGGTNPATVQDFATEFSAMCVQSASTATGSTCNTSTTLNAVIPNAVKYLGRALWELQAFQILDGGADGDGDTAADNTVFARPGAFIP